MTLRHPTRHLQMEYTRLVTMADPGGGRYRPFAQITADALKHAAARLGLPLDAAATDALLSEYKELAAFDDAQPVLAALKQAGIPAAILSNGDPEMLAAAAASGGLTDLLDHVISVAPLRVYKPDMRVYDLGLQTLRRGGAGALPDLKPEEVLFVSSNGWDAAGATWFGFTTFWCNRGALPREELGVVPSHEGRQLKEILPLLGIEAAGGGGGGA